MTIRHEVVKQYHRKELITIDLLTLEQYRRNERDTILHKIDGSWLPFKPPVRDYANYTHGLAPESMKVLYPEHYQRIFGERH